MMDMFSRKALITVLAGSVSLIAFSAQAQKAPELSFYPTKGWTIQKTAVGCAMQSEFNNGFILGLSSAGVGAQDMSVNFRQNIFETGKAYDVELSVPGVASQNVKASAINPSTLNVDLSAREGLYKQMRKSGVADFKIQQNFFRFYMTGLAASAQQFDRCASGAQPAPQAPQIAQAPAPAKEESMTPMPSASKEKDGQTAMLGLSADGDLVDMPSSEGFKVNEAVAMEAAEKNKALSSDKGYKRLSEELSEQINQNPDIIAMDDEPDYDKPAIVASSKDLTDIPAPAPESDLAAAEEAQPVVEAEVVIEEEAVLQPLPVEEVEEAAVVMPVEEKLSESVEWNEPAPAPEAEPIEAQAMHYETPPMKVNKEVMSAEADFTALEPSAQERAEYREMAAKISDLERMVDTLKSENLSLNSELKSSLKESEQERLSISSDNWNLERATMKFNEAERQVKKLGQQLQKERAQCKVEKKDLEGMLFDPQLTNEQQLARLADLEDQLTKAQRELQDQRMRYEEQIRLLRSQSAK